MAAGAEEAPGHQRAAPTTSCGLPGAMPLPLPDPGVLNDLKKVLAGEKLSPILVAEADIADGHHRVSLAYALDPYAGRAAQARLGTCPRG